MAKTKVGIIGTVGIPAKYGGFETLAHQLVLQLSRRLDFTVYSSSKSYSKEEQVANWKGAKIKYIPLKANGVQSIPYDILSMIHAMIYCEVLLILGVSGCIFLPFVKLFTNKRIVVNVDGLEWRRAKWGGLVKQFLLFSEWMAVQCADQIITDNAALQTYVREEYGIGSSLIEYGADHVEAVPNINESKDFPFLINDYAFKVCRIEPENNIHIVLQAFQQMPQIPLIIVGNWKDSNYGQALLEEYKDIGHFYLLDPIYEPSILNRLRSNCLLYIHGHSAGGTNPSLVEAMYLGLPILAFDVVYNKVTTEYSAEYFTSPEDLIRATLALSTTALSALGKTMQSIAKRRYTWKTIAGKYEAIVLEREVVPIPSIAI